MKYPQTNGWRNLTDEKRISDERRLVMKLFSTNRENIQETREQSMDIETKMTEGREQATSRG